MTVPLIFDSGDSCAVTGVRLRAPLVITSWVSGNQPSKLVGSGNFSPCWRAPFALPVMS
jgi:hypothetical protein